MHLLCRADGPIFRGAAMKKALIPRGREPEHSRGTTPISVTAQLCEVPSYLRSGNGERPRPSLLGRSGLPFSWRLRKDFRPVACIRFSPGADSLEQARTPTRFHQSRCIWGGAFVAGTDSPFFAFQVYHGPGQLSKVVAGCYNLCGTGFSLGRGATTRVAPMGWPGCGF